MKTNKKFLKVFRVLKKAYLFKILGNIKTELIFNLFKKDDESQTKSTE